MELLLRAFGGKFAAPGNPWMHASTEPEGPGQVRAWIDFAAIPDGDGTASRGKGYLDPWPRALHAV
jgi:hypothetical protein